ncbi:MAG TPA: hypothetical protein VE685_10810 [Thermoanaerobaculia bacterium]|nr:hypothetical protein [Thermoanaerobaculia bacterium]
MKRALCLALFGLLCCGLSIGLAEEAPSAAPLPFLAPSCSSMSPAQPAVEDQEALSAELLLPEPQLTASCTVRVLCRCGQRLSCTSASGNCQSVPSCSVTCDFNEQTCPPCNGFACF